jgi:hypothetical protein
MINLTQLEGVNEVLSRSGMMPVASADSTGSWPTRSYGRSDGGNAERALDRATKEMCALGKLPSSLSRNKQFTLASAGQLLVGANAQQVVGVGQLAGKTLSLRHVTNNTAVWNATDGGTDQFAAGTYVLDVTELRAFDTLPGDEQQVVLARATELFQRNVTPELVQRDDIAGDAGFAEANTTSVIPTLQPGMQRVRPSAAQPQQR